MKKISILVLSEILSTSYISEHPKNQRIGLKVFLIFALISLFILPTILAVDLTVSSPDVNGVYVVGLSKPATFDLKITNNGNGDNFLFYNLLGFKMTPIGTVPIYGHETKNLQLTIVPREDLNYRGFYTFEYYIQGQDKSEAQEKLTMEIIDLKDAFDVGSGEVHVDSNSIDIYMYNKKNYQFDNVKAKFSSSFFNFEKDLSLAPYEKKTFTVQLNKDDFKKLIAGVYPVTLETEVEGKTAKVEGVIKYIEKDIVVSSKKEYGLFVNTEIISKTNQGNVVSKSNTVIMKNIISRLFTNFSPEPDIVDRNGLVVYYTWNRDVKPGESFDITIKTNWLLPLLIIFFILAVIILVKKYTRRNILVNKKVSFVKAKGGEFALKVSIIIQAKRHVEKISVIDKLPPLVKLYERFGAEKPVRVDERNKRIEWNFEKLDAGEARIMSYVIYSKVGVMGKFVLPSATTVYEREGKVHEEESNRAFFVTEQISRESDIE